jgi:hypothetical protein
MDVTKVSEQPKTASSIKKFVAMKALKTKLKNHDNSGSKQEGASPTDGNDP